MTAAAYLALMTVWVYGVLDRHVPGSELLLPLVASAQFVLGFVNGRWYAASLPVAVVLISVAAGYPPLNGGEPFPLWVSLAFGALVAMPLVAVGLASRKLVAWRWA